MTIGVWAIVLQNAEVIPINQNVKVVNEIDAYMEDNVETDVSDSVNVDNTVDINIQKINGKSNVFYQDSDDAYMVLPVTSR